MTDDKVIDLDRAPPSVESVVTRLFHQMENIASITCVVEWKDGDVQWCGKAKDVKEMCYHAMYLQRACLEMLPEDEWDYE